MINLVVGIESELMSNEAEAISNEIGSMSNEIGSMNNEIESMSNEAEAISPDNENEYIRVYKEENEMYIIAGLGNPGKEYENTRHNAGFMSIDAIADKYGIEVNKKQFKGLTGRGMIGGQQVLLLKPLTFMNLSGESVRQAFDFYKPEIDQVIILFDDISLPIGQLRVRKKGSAGGHNGIKSIISHLGSQDFPRIKVGVGGPGQKDLVGHVLGHFNKEESAIMKDAVRDAASCIELFLTEGPDRAMNVFNTKKKAAEETAGASDTGK